MDAFSETLIRAPSAGVHLKELQKNLKRIQSHTEALKCGKGLKIFCVHIQIPAGV